MTLDEIVEFGRMRGRRRWGKPLPPRAIELLRQYSRESVEAEAVERSAA